jgi:ketosteroid isomerase-like protein
MGARGIAAALLVLAMPVEAAPPRAALSQLLARDKAAIIEHSARWKTLYESGDIDAMRPLYEPDAWLMTNGAPAAKGVDAILAYLRRNKASGNKAEISFAPEAIDIDGNRAYLVSRYWMAITLAGGRKVNAAGRSFLVYKRRRSGGWGLWRDMDNQAPDVRMEDRPS